MPREHVDALTGNTAYECKSVVFANGCVWMSQECSGRRIGALERELAATETARRELCDALSDMASGWRYIRETHGDLTGVGWDRAEEKARAALSKHSIP